MQFEMQPRLETLAGKKLVGLKMDMSFAGKSTRELWQKFMPLRTEMKSNTNADLFSIEIYPPHFFANFDPKAIFEKWAAIEVRDFDEVPRGMDILILPRGQYAVFTYRGPAGEGQKAYEYIFRNWIPGSDYLLDDRPHFAVMGEKYKGEDPDSEEEIWIPVKPKYA